MRTLLATSVALVCLTSARAYAEGPHVTLTYVGGGDRTDVVDERVTSWFKLHHDVTTDRATTLPADAVLADRGPAGIHAWIELTDPQRPRVFIAVREHDDGPARFLGMTLELATGLDEVGVEQLAQIVYPSANALWDGTLEMKRDEVEQQLKETAPVTPIPAITGGVIAPPPEQAHEPGRVMFVHAGADYTAAISGVGVVQTVGGHVDVWHVRLRLARELPRDASDGGVTLALSGARASVGVVLRRPLAAHTAFEGELAAGLELTHYTPRVDDPSLMATNGGSIKEPIAEARAGIHRTVGGVTLGLAATVMTHMQRTHYDVEISGREVPVVVPWIVQPGLAAYVAY